MESSIFVVKTSIGHEKDVADAIYNKAKKNEDVFAILFPTRLRGYLFVESSGEQELQRIIKGITHVRGLIKGTTPINEIQHFFTPKPVVSHMSEGDIVEIVAGPFKGEKARLQTIDENKEEITIELFEAMVPIPITIRADHVRVVEKK
ncbi:MAG: transcription elongation factor Spt5 [Thermoplasmatales archaeon]|nr:transcription elongation factor Spt5 [Thermoplasmatales archaeon]